jgi:hypothetical protein
MSGSAPAIDGNDIYLATGNGMDPGTKPDNFAESFVKLHYTAGLSGVNNGKPTLTVNDYWGAFSDFERRDKAAPQDREAAQDQDLGAAGVVLIPARGNLIGGGKDGILYNLNKDNLGKNSWDPHFNLPFVATYLPKRAEWTGRSTDHDGGQSELADRQTRAQPSRADTRAQELSYPWNSRVHGTGEQRDSVCLGRERAHQGL